MYNPIILSYIYYTPEMGVNMWLMVYNRTIP